MATEVCSIYVRRAGDVLELFATQGLRATAVRRTRLRVGEGLIGEIAAKGRPLALTDAQSHPNFAFRPETGEEIYQSLMGVPILRGGRVVGVLAVQNVNRRQYTDEEIEALQTVAMVLAELVASGDLVGRDELSPTEGLALAPMRLEGARLNAGLGIGVAVLHKHQFTIRRLVAEDTRIEHDRLRKAVAEMHGALDNMLRASAIAGSGEHRDVLETYRLIAEDVGWLRRIGDAINTGLTAEAAVQKVNDDIHARMRQVSDSYLRERVHDLEDLANRLLQHLLHGDEDAVAEPAARRPGLRAGRPQPRAGAASRLSRRQPEGGGAGGRLAQRARRDRRPCPRHSGGRPGAGCAGAHRERRSADRRCRPRAGAGPAERRRPRRCSGAA